MKKLKNEFIWSKYQLDGKVGYFLFLTITLGVFVSCFSIYDTKNLYEIVNIILHNNFFLSLLFISNGLCIFKITKDIVGNINYIIRIGTTFDAIKDIQTKIFISNLIIFLIVIMLVTSASIIFSFNGLNLFCDNFYFYILNNIYNYCSIFIFIHLLSLIISYLIVICDDNNYKYIILFYLLFVIIFFFLSPKIYVVNFWDVPFIFLWCLGGNVIYKNFFLDLFCISVHLCIISFVYIIILEVTKKYRGGKYEISK